MLRLIHIFLFIFIMNNINIIYELYLASVEGVFDNR